MYVGVEYVRLESRLIKNVQMTSFIMQNIFEKNYQDLRKYEKIKFTNRQKITYVYLANRCSKLLNINNTNHTTVSNRDNNYKLCWKIIIRSKKTG